MGEEEKKTTHKRDNDLRCYSFPRQASSGSPTVGRRAFDTIDSGSEKLKLLSRNLAGRAQEFSRSFLFFPFGFLGPHSQHMEVPRLGVVLELQLLAYATAITTPDLSHSVTYTAACCNARP